MPLAQFSITACIYVYIHSGINYAELLTVDAESDFDFEQPNSWQDYMAHRIITKTMPF